MARHVRVTTVTDNFRKLLIFHWLRMYIKILGSCLRDLGFGIWFLHYLIKVPLKVAYVQITMFLDNVFFPGYRQVKVERPVFIIGHPRSGTTFLHTILTQTEEFVAFTQWQTNSPALIGRRLFERYRLLQLLLFALLDFRFSPARIKRTIKKRLKGEPTRGGITGTGEWLMDMQGEISQEEEPLFLNVLDTQFLSLVTPLGFSKKGYPEICFNDHQPHQQRSVLFLKECFKRQIYYTGKKQIVAKMNFSLFRMKTLLRLFPDARIIHVRRSPLETIPSHLSLHHNRIDSVFDTTKFPSDAVAQYLKNRYEYNVQFYRYFDDLIDNSEIPRSQFLEITYDAIKNDLWNQMQRIKDFAGLQFSPELEGELRRQAKEQSSYKRPHVNLPLEAFHLTEEKVRSDFDVYFKRYGLG